MKIKLLINLCVKELIRNSKRTVLTMFGIVIGVASVITIIALGNGLEDHTVKNMTGNQEGKIRLIVNFIPGDKNLFEESIDYFSENDLKLLNSIRGISDAKLKRTREDTFYQNIFINGKMYNNKPIESVIQSKVNIKYGRNLTKMDSELKNKVLVIPTSIIKEFSFSEEDALDYSIEINGQLFSIIGVYNSQKEDTFLDFKSILVPKTTYNRFFSTNNNISYMEMLVNAQVNSEEIKWKIINKLSSEGMMKQEGSYEVTDTSQIASGVGKVLKSVTIFVALVAGIALFIAGVGVMNMIFTSVSERKKEIGIRRALGATKKDIRNEFLIEGILITLTGGLIGYVLGIVVAGLLSVLLGYKVYPDVYTIAIAVGISVLVGILSSILPAIKASEENTVDILR